MLIKILRLLCGPLCTSAFSAINNNFNTEVAVIRRGPQRAKLFILLPLIVAASANAAVRLPAIISDNMILQQGIKVRIWGSANAGEHVAVTVDKKTSNIIADAQGRWQVLIGPLKAGGPYLKAPIGLIHSSWRGTPAEAWTSIEALRSSPELKPILDRYESSLNPLPQTKPLTRRHWPNGKRRISTSTARTRAKLWGTQIRPYRQRVGVRWNYPNKSKRRA